MADKFDTLILGGNIQTHQSLGKGDIGIIGGKIAAIGALGSASAENVIDATGLTIFPGVIDTQVHFREPGNTHKEDLESGARCAVMGGVTAVFEMPNTNPLTTTVDALNDKLRRAYHRMWCDHAFYVGATGDNAEELKVLERMPGTAGVKVFMGSSTGDLLVRDDETLRRVLISGTRRVAIHSEDEDRLIERKSFREIGGVHQHPVWRDDETAIKSTKRLLAIARDVGRKTHVLHVTTADEMKLLGEAKAATRGMISIEVTPQHLSLYAPDCYDRLGTYAQMNPPIRDKRHMDGLWAGLAAGTVDVIGSDHAPHTKEEKAQGYPNTPSGMPGVQTLFPVMLTHAAKGRLSYERLVDLTSLGAKRLFDLSTKGEILVGNDADFTIVDVKKEWVIEEKWLQSRCGWSPFTGDTMIGKPIGTIIRGQTVMWEDELLGSAIGEPIAFNL